MTKRISFNPNSLSPSLSTVGLKLFYFIAPSATQSLACTLTHDTTNKRKPMLTEKKGKCTLVVYYVPSNLLNVLEDGSIHKKPTV